MLDAYTLDANTASLDASYAAVATAFERVFTRCGVRFVAVEASAGEMGGAEPREYMALSSSGEDVLALCAACGYAANSEVAARGANPVVAATAAEIERIATPQAATIAELAALLGVSATATAKAVFFDTPRGLVFAVVRGDLDVNEAKLRAILGSFRACPGVARPNRGGGGGCWLCFTSWFGRAAR